MKHTIIRTDNALKNRQYLKQSAIIFEMFALEPYERSFAISLVEERFTPESEMVNKKEKMDIMIDQLPKSLLDISLDKNILKIIEIVLSIIVESVSISPFFINTLYILIIFSILKSIKIYVTKTKDMKFLLMPEHKIENYIIYSIIIIKGVSKDEIIHNRRW